MKALSVSSAILPRLSGARLRGAGLGEGYVDFGTFVLAVTMPGRPRMPNGVETAVRVERGGEVWLGDGALRIGDTALEPGPTWDPVPVVRFRPAGGPHLRPDLEAVVGRGPGLTPAGDDVLAGYAAGLTLFRDARAEALAIARSVVDRTTLLSVTLIDHASRGELPEPAHAYLGRGDVDALDRFGHSSGRCLRLGLELAAAGPDGRPAGLEELLGMAGVERGSSATRTGQKAF